MSLLNCSSSFFLLGSLLLLGHCSRLVSANLLTCGTSNTRRRLSDSSEDLASLLRGGCASTKYDLYLHMPSVHISLVAIRRDSIITAAPPSVELGDITRTASTEASRDETNDEECAQILWMNDAGEGVGKELIVSDFTSELLEDDPHYIKIENNGAIKDEKGQDLLLVSESLPLAKLLPAWKRAQAPKVYDPLWDNCMMVLGDVMRGIGYTPGAAVVNYVSSTIVREKERIVQLIDERRDRSKISNSFLSFFDFSFVVGSSYLVESYCWQFVKRHERIWEARHDKLEEQLPVPPVGDDSQSDRNLQSFDCDLCYLGESLDPANYNELAFFPGVGRLDCGLAECASLIYDEGTPECTTAQISGHIHCGCPLLPPKNDAIPCEFCDGGEFTDIDFKKEVPEFPDLSFIRPSGARTCFDIVANQNALQDTELCPLYHYLRYFCGCPGESAPPPCPLCEDPADTVPNLDLVVLPRDVTCRDVQTLANSGLLPESYCSAFQATAGAYCGCDNSVAIASAQSSSCYMCDSGARSIPDPNIPIILSYAFFEDTPVELAGFSCGGLEFEAISTGRCDPSDVTRLFDDACGCNPPPNPCGVCNSPGERINIGSDNDYLIYNLFGLEITCGTIAAYLDNTEVSLFPDLDTFTPQECSKWHHIMYDYCGICSGETPPVISSCDFPCNYQNLDTTNDLCLRAYFESLGLGDSEDDQIFCEISLEVGEEENCCIPSPAFPKQSKKAKKDTKAPTSSKASKSSSARRQLTTDEASISEAQERMLDRSNDELRKLFGDALEFFIRN